MKNNQNIKEIINDQKTKERSRERESEKENKKGKEKYLKLGESSFNIKSIQSENCYKEKIKNIKNKMNCVSVKSAIDKYDSENSSLLKTSDKNVIDKNVELTPDEYINYYTQTIINQIKSMKKSTKFASLPILPYGAKLSDLQFIKLFKECILFANYNLSKDDHEKIKKRLIDSEYDLNNLFISPQILKDLKENALLTILTSNNKDDQDDNFSILKTQYTSVTPLINLDFENQEINKKELIETFSSYVYLMNYIKTLKKFITNLNLTQTKLKEYINNYFIKHDIYFSDFPDRILALSIHTGNIYLNGKYLKEYYTEKSKDSQIIIREKLILNIAHELNHVLLREIDEKMKKNFFIKSDFKKKKDSKKEDNILYVSKFDPKKSHILNLNESGNVFDHYFFNKFYFNNLFIKEAEFFYNIKNIKSMKEYNKKLNDIIKKEQLSPPLNTSVNKFKKMEEEPTRCIKSRILGTKNIKNIDECKLSSDSDSDWDSD